MSNGTDFVERFYEVLAAGDVDAVLALYEPDAEIVRYDGVADSPGAIAAYFRNFLMHHPGFTLRSVDQLREADDVLMWDALVDTDNGILMTVHVVVFGDDGRIRRHIPGVRGYWGG
jgi:ketosteroid isomerase-like protein